MSEKVTVESAAADEADGGRSSGVGGWDYQVAVIADRAGVEIVAGGDSVTAFNLGGQSSPREFTMEEMS